MQETEDASLGGYANVLPLWQPEDQPPVEPDEDQEQYQPGRVYSTEDIARFVLDRDKEIHVSKLKWDKECTLGQIRRVSHKMVDHYVEQLRLNPPRNLIPVLVRALPGMWYW
jgi:hypothetical protein